MSIAPSTQIKVGIPTLEIKFLAKQNVLTHSQVMDTIQDMLMYVLDELILELETWINSKVPKRTGQLRDSLIDNLHSSTVKIGLMEIILGTLLPYAEDVAAMTTTQVRHSGEDGSAYYYGNYGKIILDDPDAIGNFWVELLNYSRERTMSVLDRAISEYFKGHGKLIKSIKGGL